MEPAIQTNGLTKRFGGRTAVDQLDLEVARGEVFGFLGPNGAGKTTTIGMLLGLIRPTAGSALVLGHDIQRAPAAALRGVGAMIETPAFYPYLSGRDNLRALAQAGGMPSANVDDVLARVELTARASDSFRTYSQGMRQRLGIAAALLNDPQLIILDEPTNGLDPAGQQEIHELIGRLSAGGSTVFLCSHQLHEVERLCGRVAILKAGKIIAHGRVDELLRRGEAVLVRVDGDPTLAAEQLRSLPWVRQVELRDGALLVGAPVARAAEINALLNAMGLPVAEVRAHEVRLEDFFLEVTGAT